MKPDRDTKRPAAQRRARNETPPVASVTAVRLRWLATGLVVATLAIQAVWTSIDRVTDVDIWWTMAAGRYIVEHGTVPDRDVLSYTHAGWPWFNSEWLSQVVFYLLYEHGGGTLLAGFKIAAVVAMFALIAWIGWRRSGSVFFAVAAAVFAAYSCRGFLDIRAQLFFFLSTLTVIAILEEYRRGNRPWIPWLLPVVMVLWVNLHFSAVFGIGVLLLYVVAETAKSRLGLPRDPLPPPATRRLLAPVAVAALAALLNPYGIWAVIEVFTLLGSESGWRAEMLEWEPPALFADGPVNPIAFSYLLLAQVIVALTVLWRQRRRLDLTDSLLVLVTAIMALSARRFVPLFAVVSAPFLAANLAALRDHFFPRPAGVPELASPRAALAASAAAIVAAAALLAHAVPAARATLEPGLFEGLVNAYYFPRGPVEFLRLNPLPARLFHPYAWGAYINFELPDRPTFIDGRANTVFPWDFYLESKAAQHGKPEWSEIMDRWEVSVVVWPSAYADGPALEALKRFSTSKDWLRIYDDSHSAVFAHVERAKPWVERFRSFQLAYPDLPGAQLFLAQAYLNAKEFGRAREQMLTALARTPEARAATEQAQDGYARLARSRDTAAAWFGLGFYADVNRDADAARQAFTVALARGAVDPEASYARESLRRLGVSPSS